MKKVTVSTPTALRMLEARNSVFFNVACGLIRAHQEPEQAFALAAEVAKKCNGRPYPKLPDEVENTGEWIFRTYRPGLKIKWDDRFLVEYRGAAHDEARNVTWEEEWEVEFSEDSSLAGLYNSLIEKANSLP